MMTKDKLTGRNFLGMAIAALALCCGCPALAQPLATHAVVGAVAPAVTLPDSGTLMPARLAFRPLPPAPSKTTYLHSGTSQVWPISMDLRDLLLNQSGLDIIDGQVGVLGCAGYSFGVGSRVALLVDGLPLQSADGGEALYALIPPDRLEIMDVNKTPTALRDGSGSLGGTVSIHLASPSAVPATILRWQGGLFGMPRDPGLDWNGTKSAKNMGMSLSHSRTIGRAGFLVFGDLWRDQGWRYGTTGLQGRAMVRTKFAPKKVSGLAFGVNAGMVMDSSSTFLFWDAYHPVPSTGNAYLVPFGTTDTVFAAMGALAGTATARHQLRSHFLVDPYLRYATAKNREHRYSGRLLRSTLANDVAQSTQSTQVYHRYIYYVPNIKKHLDLWNGAVLSHATVNGDTVYEGRHHTFNAALYSEGRLEAMKRQFTANGGGRLDLWQVDNLKTRLRPVFNAGVSYSIEYETNVRASFSQGFRNPSIAELYSRTWQGPLQVVPNPSLLPERSNIMDIGIGHLFSISRNEWRVRPFVSLTGFWADYENLIELAPYRPENSIGTELLHRYANVAHTRTTGLEFRTHLEISRQRFYMELDGGVTYMNPMNRNAADAAQQADLLNTIGTQQQPFTLDAYATVANLYSPASSPGHLTDNPSSAKYRSKWLVRGNVLLGYKFIQMRLYYRYKSAPLAYDQMLFLHVPGSADFVRAHPGGYGVLDLVATAQLEDGYFVSMGVENLLNSAYMVRPGLIGEQRNFNIQVKMLIFGKDRSGYEW